MAELTLDLAGLGHIALLVNLDLRASPRNVEVSLDDHVCC